MFTLHFLHPRQFPALKLHYNFVQRGALAQSLHVAVGRNAPHLLVVGEHLYHIFCGKSQHLVEFWLDGNIPPNVVSARHVIKRYRAYAHHENALKVAFELLEHVADG